MGGLSSGRRRIRNRAMVEQSLSLDIRQMRRRGYLRPGLCVSGHWTWICSPSGRSAGSISFVVNLTDPAAGILELHFTLNGERQTQVIELEAAPCRFGGQRFYFRCPRTWRRCEVLACVGGEFASRQFHRLTYITQSQTRLNRLHTARRKAEARARGLEGNPIPRGQNRENLIDRWGAFEEALDEAWLSSLQRFLARFG